MVYGIFLSLKNSKQHYIKCIKMFKTSVYFNVAAKKLDYVLEYDRRRSVTMMLMDLQLPTLCTILHNATFKFRERVFDHVNSVAQYVNYVCSA